MSAESERVRQCDIDLELPRLVRDVVEIALRIRGFVVDRRGDHAFLVGKHEYDELDSPRRAEQVPGGRFRR